ncbi:hypothetical protein [Haliangium sp.]|uniref:hypothetical protein n=1 Tax=Haliangium sp. TaxID=2663208 RepID=UPI003D0CAE9E
MWEPPGQTEPLNASSAQRLEAVLTALALIARPRSALFSGPPGGESLPMLKWQSGSNAAFQREVLATLADAPFPITSAEIELDLFAWVHVEDQSAPIQGWLERAADLDMSFETEAPYSALAMGHTLYRDGNTNGPSNHELHLLNAPMLKAALAAVEAVEGPITEVEGFTDVTREGFATWSEEDWALDD